MLTLIRDVFACIKDWAWVTKEFNLDLSMITFNVENKPPELCFIVSPHTLISFHWK